MNNLDDRLARFNPIQAKDVSDAVDSAEAGQLLRFLISQSVTGDAWHMPVRRRRRRWVWITALAGVAAVVTGVLLWQSKPQVPAGPSAVTEKHLVAFSVRHGIVTALITDPYAAASQLTAVLEAHGLRISVQTVPASPSLVGTIVYTDTPGIRTLWKPDCAETGCPVGLVIPASFTGRATIAVGRPARHGEQYESMADVFAPGEALHCSGLLGAPATAALPVLRKLGLSATWENLNDPKWPNGSGRAMQTMRHPAGYIIDGVSASATHVNLDTLPALPRNRQFRDLVSEWNRGCR